MLNTVWIISPLFCIDPSVFPFKEKRLASWKHEKSRGVNYIVFDTRRCKVFYMIFDFEISCWSCSKALLFEYVSHLWFLLILRWEYRFRARLEWHKNNQGRCEYVIGKKVLYVNISKWRILQNSIVSNIIFPRTKNINRLQVPKYVMYLEHIIFR